jgi:isopentenyldiphosphate isomerase
LGGKTIKYDTMVLQNSEEIFPIVDDEGNVIGEAKRSVCHDGRSMLLHPVVHLHLFNGSGKMFLQKRSVSKDIQPGKWDTSVGGHVFPGELIDEALEREIMEEIGLIISNPGFLGRYIWKSSVERELVHVFSAVSEEIPVIDPVEIDEGRFWSIDEIKSSIGKNIFTQNFENEFLKFFSE